MADDVRINSAVAAYKRYLQELIDRRPSGLRGRLARSLGKHKSFVSQITSPNYPAPIPAGHLATIIQQCQLSPTESAKLRTLYRQAHGGELASDAMAPSRTLTIELPVFHYVDTAREVETVIRAFARSTIDLAQRVERAKQTSTNLGGHES